MLTCNPGIEPIQVLMFHQPDQDPTIELLLVHELCNQEALVKYDPAAKEFPIMSMVVGKPSRMDLEDGVYGHMLVVREGPLVWPKSTLHRMMQMRGMI